MKMLPIGIDSTTLPNKKWLKTVLHFLTGGGKHPYFENIDLNLPSRDIPQS